MHYTVLNQTKQKIYLKVLVAFLTTSCVNELFFSVWILYTGTNMQLHKYVVAAVQIPAANLTYWQLPMVKEI